MRRLEGKKFRVAPRNENKRDQNLDGMIVVPSYDESTKILNTIYSVVTQLQTKGDKFSHGITVVINNKPDSPQKIKESNFTTYVLLQALEHGFPIKIKDDKGSGKLIKTIQDSKVPIHVVDTFSEGNANQENNVGLARKIGTEYAGPKIKDNGFFISTDADTLLGRSVFAITKKIFESTDSHALQYRMEINHLHTNKEERNADAMRSLRYMLTSLVNPKQDRISESLLWLSGGGSSFKKEAYKQTSGYRELKGEEDTLLGVEFSENGFNVLDASKMDLESISKSTDYKNILNYFYVSTRTRISDRASTGFGRLIGSWSEAGGDFASKKIDNPEGLVTKSNFLTDIDKVYLTLFENWKEDRGYSKENYKDVNIFSKSEAHKSLVDTFFKETKNKQENLIDIVCDEYLRNDQLDFFKQTTNNTKNEAEELTNLLKSWDPRNINTSSHHKIYKLTNNIFERLYPRVTVYEYVQLMEEHTAEIDSKTKTIPYLETLAKICPGMPVNYKTFESKLLQTVRQIGLDTNDNNMRTKVKIVVMDEYQQYFRLITSYLEMLAINKLLKIKLATDEYSNDLLFNEEVMSTNLENDFRASTVITIRKLIDTIKHSLTKEQTTTLKTESKKIIQEYRKFHDEVFLPIHEAEKPKIAKRIGLFEKFLKNEEQLEQV